VEATVAPGGVGRFSFAVTGGDSPYVQAFSMLEEGTAWFADRPHGGVTPDAFLTLELVVADEPNGGDSAESVPGGFPGEPASREAVGGCGCGRADGGGWWVVGVALFLAKKPRGVAR
jgi:hypothetical protein